jgi:lysophospholipase L1-like esterase
MKTFVRGSDRRQVLQVLALALAVVCAGCNSGGDDQQSNPIGTAPGAGGVGSGGAPAMPGVVAGTAAVVAGASGAPIMGPDAQAGASAGGTAGVGATAGAGGTPAVGGSGSAGTGEPIAGTGAGVGEAGSGGAAGAEPPAVAKPCIQNANEVLIIGDSYVDYVNPLQPPLEANATADGQLPAGQHYTNLAVAGTLIADIERQWQSGKRNMPKFVVGDGGGNDVLIGAPQCLNAGAQNNTTCTDVVARANMVAARMIQDMKASGVRGLVFFFYPHIPNGGHDILDYSYPMAKAACEGASDANFTCAFVDTRAAFEGHPEHFFFDGIHPSASGSKVIADLVWAAMKDNCFAQTGGCCM